MFLLTTLETRGLSLSKKPSKWWPTKSKTEYHASLTWALYSDAFVQRIFDLNVHGTMRVTQSVLPYFRAQKSGKIAFMGSCVAWGPFPIFTHYAAAKAALDGTLKGH